MSDSESLRDESSSDSDDSKVIEYGDSDVNREKIEVLKPPTKVIIRRLPPSLTEDVIIKHLSPLPPYDYFLFVKADRTLGAFAFSRVYINFVSHDDVFQFKERFDNYIFLDKKGNEYHAIVEFAPFQRLSKKTAVSSNDPKCDTLEQDQTYISFLENYMLYNSSSGSHSTVELYPSADETPVETTPLLDYVRERYAEKQRFKDERKDERERRRKEFERRDELRRKEYERKEEIRRKELERREEIRRKDFERREEMRKKELERKEEQRKKDLERKRAKDSKESDQGKQKDDTANETSLAKKDKTVSEKDESKKDETKKDEPKTDSKRNSLLDEEFCLEEVQWKESDILKLQEKLKNPEDKKKNEDTTEERSASDTRKTHGYHSDRVTSSSRDRKYSNEHVASTSRRYDKYDKFDKYQSREKPYKRSYGSASWEHGPSDKRSSSYRFEKKPYKSEHIPYTDSTSSKYKSRSKSVDEEGSETRHSEHSFKKDTDKWNNSGKSRHIVPKDGKRSSVYYKSNSSDQCKFLCCEVPEGVVASKLLTPLELALWCQRNSSSSFVWNVRNLFDWKLIIAFHRASRFEDQKEKSEISEEGLKEQLSVKNYTKILQMYFGKSHSRKEEETEEKSTIEKSDDNSKVSSNESGVNKDSGAHSGSDGEGSAEANEVNDTEDMEVMLRRNLEAILRSDSDETPGSPRISESQIPKDPRLERRIRNKDRPDMQIYRPGMGKFSMMRKEREKKPSPSECAENESSSPSVSPSPNRGIIRSSTFRRSVGRDK